MCKGAHGWERLTVLWQRVTLAPDVVPDVLSAVLQPQTPPRESLCHGQESKVLWSWHREGQSLESTAGAGRSHRQSQGEEAEGGEEEQSQDEEDEGDEEAEGCEEEQSRGEEDEGAEEAEGCEEAEGSEEDGAEQG